MTATILEQAGDTLGGYIPRFAGAILLLLIGLLAVAVIRRLVRRGLQAAGVDTLGERWGAHDVLARVGLPRSLSAVLPGRCGSGCCSSWSSRPCPCWASRSCRIR